MEPRVYFLLCWFILSGCASRSQEWTYGEMYQSRPLIYSRGKAGFQELGSRETGLVARNNVPMDSIVANRHFMHGSGIAIGDVDGDEWPDIYVARLTASDVLYRNLGQWRFKDISSEAGLDADSYASTGAVFADIDGDRDLDLLVTMLTGPNAVYLNDGHGQFSQVHEAAGLQSSYASTTMTLADVDGDADLDLYVARYKRIALADSLPSEALAWEQTLIDSTLEARPHFKEHYAFRMSGNRMIRSELGEPDALYLNDGLGRFEAVSWTGGGFLDAFGQPITQIPRGWGLTARFHDVNNDRIPDLYVCNDFDSPDAFWLGQAGGVFRLVSPEAVRKTSNATMSIDFSDINRDSHVDFFMTDMLSRDHVQRQRQRNTRIPEEAPPGDLNFRPQEMQNMLMLNRGDDTWAEIARLAGVAASDWSWATSFMDVDLDGYEDILITTGHVFDVQDLDAQALEQRRMPRVRRWQEARRLVLDFPTLALPNVAFRNRGDLSFEDMPEAWGLGEVNDVAHGMALGDLDNDGDLDVVTNRLNGTPGVYRNSGGSMRLAVELLGQAPNTYGVGARIRLLCPDLPDQQKEITAGGMYLSGSQMRATFAAGEAPCRIEVDWRNGSQSTVPVAVADHLYQIIEPATPGQPVVMEDGFIAPLFAANGTLSPFVDQMYEDFARQPLLPWRLSRYSPAAVIFDLDGDHLEDIIVGGGQGGNTTIYGSRIGHVTLERLRGDVTGLVMTPVSNEHTRIFLGSSNYERGPSEARDSSWIYIYDVASNGAWQQHARLLFGQSAPGPLALFDADLDTDLDLFVGGHFVPGRYPEPARSAVYLNEEDVYVYSPSLSRPFQDVGNVSSSAFGDLDNDGDMDVVLAFEWGPVRIFLREGATFIDRTRKYRVDGSTGWWRGVVLGDFDTDGHLDIAATNGGWNTRYGRLQPVRLYYGDLDANGIMDIIESFPGGERQRYVPSRNLIDLASAIPLLRSRFSSHTAFATTHTSDLLPDFDYAVNVVEASSLGSAVFFNRGEYFEAQPLPLKAQFSTGTGNCRAGCRYGRE